MGEGWLEGEGGGLGLERRGELEEVEALIQQACAKSEFLSVGISLFHQFHACIFGILPNVQRKWNLRLSL